MATTPETKDSRLVEAVARFKTAEEAWSPNRKAFLEDMKFRALDQWPDKIKSDREKSHRPCLVVDKLNQYIRQVVNDGRQNRPSVKVHPVDDGNEKVAESFQGLIRRICRQSNADEAFDTALDHAVSGGFGFFRVLTDYAHENTFEQEIEVQRIRNPRGVLLDPNIRAADGSDAEYGFIVDEVTRDEFKRKWPKAKFTDWEFDLPKYSDGWTSGENVRVAEYFYAEDDPGELHLLADGTSIRDDDYEKAVKELGANKVPKIIETRVVPLRKVKWCRLSGAEILEENDWLGQYIPIIPVFGNEYDLDGKVIYSGLIRGARDAQRLYNYARSAYVEFVALQPKAPWVAATGQVQNHPEWQDANTENYSVLEYDAIDINGNPIPPPQRSQPPSGAPGWAQDMQMAEHDIQASMGMYAASVGQPSNEKSGRAIMARQREGDTATFHYQDNLNRAICYLGRILVDLIPKIYDSKRVVRILHEDGQTDSIQLDPTQKLPYQQIGGTEIYNLNAGKYDVSVETGPSYTTKRQEALEAGMQLAQANPQIWALIGDIIVRNADWPGASEIADRLKAMLPPQIQQMLSQGQQLPPEIQQAMQTVQQGHQQVQQAQQELMQAHQRLLQERAANDAQKVQLEALAAKLAAADKVLQANYQELSAKLELEATKLGEMVPPTMPPGTNEPAIAPDVSTQPGQVGADGVPVDKTEALAELMHDLHGQVMQGIGAHTQTLQEHAQALSDLASRIPKKRNSRPQPNGV